MSCSEQRPTTNHVIIDTPNDMPSDIKQTAKSMMVGRGWDNQTKLSFPNKCLSKVGGKFQQELGKIMHGITKHSLAASALKVMFKTNQ